MEDLNFDEQDNGQPIRDRRYVKNSNKSGERASKARPSRWRDIELLQEQRQLEQQLRDVFS